MAEELDRRNQARKEEEAEILQQIAAQVQEHPELLQQRVLVFAGENWHHGVIGIAASRLQERFGKPTILVTIEEGTARGSMRSFGAFSAFRCLQACESVLLRYGGHPGAGGFSLPSDQVETFQEMVQSYARESFPVMPEFTLEADKLLLPEELTLENIASLSVLAPFGEGNSVPVFAVCHAVLQQLLPLSNGVHTKLRVTYGTMAMDLLLFRTRPEEVQLQFYHSIKGLEHCLVMRCAYAGRCLRLPDYRRSHIVSGEQPDFRHCQGLPEERNAAGEISRRQKHLCAVLPAGTAASGILSGDHASA